MKYKICFDLDNILNTTVKNYYSKSKPKKKLLIFKYYSKIKVIL